MMELTFNVSRVSYQAVFPVKMYSLIKPIVAAVYVGVTSVNSIVVKWESNFFKTGYDENVCVLISYMQILSYLGFPPCIASTCNLF